MSTIIQTQSVPFSIYLNNAPASGGILLNGPSSYQRNSNNNRVHRPHEKYATTKSLPSAHPDRNLKIRFAPLPDPRNSPIDDDRSYISSLSKGAYSSSPASITNSLPDGRSLAPSYAVSDETDEASSTNGSKRTKKNLLKKYLSVNTSPIQDATSNRGLNLFRSTSRDSNSSSDDVSVDSPASSTSRARRPSKEKEGFSFTSKYRRSSSPYRASVSNLGPSSASAALGGSSPGLPVPPSPRGKSQPLRPTISAPSVTDSPIRLLNGRVYGSSAKSQSQSKSTDAKDWAEPEFVEWGYGGMGSVNSGEAFYGGVQSGSSAVAGGDDDSGMGWVRRRREERARKEREEKERKEKEANSSSSPTAPKIVVSNEEHDYRTVTIPHHHHSRHPSRTNSASSAGSIPTITNKSIAPRPSPLSATYSHSHADFDLKRSSSASSSSSVSSSNSSRSRRNSNSNEDDDDDDDDSLRDESRVTSLCAGKEKISRHRE